MTLPLLQPEPIRTPFLNANGEITEEWKRFFRSIQNAVIALLQGGSVTPAPSGLAVLALESVDIDDLGGFIQGPPGSGPAPPNSAVQFNKGGVFGGDSRFVWDASTGTLSIIGPLDNANTIFRVKTGRLNQFGGHVTTVEQSFAYIDDIGVAGANFALFQDAGKNPADATTAEFDFNFVATGGQIQGISLTPDDYVHTIGMEMLPSASPIRFNFGNTTPGDTSADLGCSNLFAVSLTLSGLTLGSIIFAKTAGLLGQDNANFFWDATNHRLGIGTAAPGNKVTITLPTTADALADTMIGASATTQKCLVVQTKASPTANPFEAQDSTANPRIFISPAAALSSNADTWYLALKPGGAGAREYRIGTHDAAGTFLFARSDSGTALGFTPSSDNLALTLQDSSPADFRLVGDGRGGHILITPNEGGGTGVLQIGRRFSDSSTAVGASTEFWPNTGQTAAVITVVVPGGGSSVFSVLIGGNISKYNGVSTAGWGVPAIYGSGRSTAQTGAVASVATYTVGTADGSFRVSANVNVTTSTTHNFTVTVSYTDETNTAQTLTLPFIQLAGTIITAITNVTGSGPYEGISCHIRCKASTSITIGTTGTFTTVTYNCEGSIVQIS